MESATPKVRTKPRARVADKERYAEKQRKKKAAKKLHQSMAISRKTRVAAGKQNAQYQRKLNRGTNKNVIIVLNETESKDRILFKIDTTEDGLTFLTLPIINDDYIGKYLNPERHAEDSWDDAIRSMAKHDFGVDAEVVDDSGKWLVLRGCKLAERKSGYIALNVKQYRYDDWFYRDSAQLDAYRMYSGAKLERFLVINGDISKTHIYSETLGELLEYRRSVGRLKEY